MEPYRTPRGMSYRLPYSIPYETYSALCNLQWVHRGNIDIMGSWLSHTTRPLNGLEFLKGILDCWGPCVSKKSSSRIGFYLVSYPGTWFSPYRTLSFSYKALTEWVGRYERNSPVMGSTSSSHNSADSIDVLRGQQETPARNRSCHFSQVNCVSIVVLQLIFLYYAWCFSLSSIKHISVVIIDYRVCFLYFFKIDNLETHLNYITILVLTRRA